MQSEKNLGLKEARMIVQAVVKEVENTEGLPMAVAVTDRAGDVLCLERMDGVPPLPGRVCLTKAWSALQVGRDTILQREIMAGRGIDFKYCELAPPNLCLIPGGCLIKTKDGSIVGAIGTSGRSPEGDEAMSRFGLKVFEASEAYLK
jgi:glc operon protein GlcG